MLNRTSNRTNDNNQNAGISPELKTVADITLDDLQGMTESELRQVLEPLAKKNEMSLLDKIKGAAINTTSYVKDFDTQEAGRLTGKVIGFPVKRVRAFRDGLKESLQ